MKKFFYFFLFFSSITFSFSPKYEVRAVWVTTLGGMDWPRSKKMDEQKKELIQIFDILQQRNFNTIFFQVRPRGTVLFQSQYEPWAMELTGTFGKNPGWDPLTFAIDEAHKRGMEIHAWFNVAKVYSKNTPPNTTPQHLVLKKPEWLRYYENEWWMDMGIPEAREYTKNLAMEIIRNYDVDGFHFDYIRYPGKDFDDEQTFQQLSDGVARDEWRRNNITEFVREMYIDITKEKPWVKIGSAPLGIYKPIATAQFAFSSFLDASQDSRRWLQEKIHDYIVPQVYWSFGEQTSPADPDFRLVSLDWLRNTYNRHVYIGVGIYKEQVLAEVEEQITLSRLAQSNGESFFRYENVLQMPQVYPFPALVSPMPWKDSIPPPSPINIQTKEISASINLIQWSVADGEKPERFVVYRAVNKEPDVNNPEHIFKILPKTQTSLYDTLKNIIGMKCYYTVTSVDRIGNESISPTQLASLPHQQIPFLTKLMLESKPVLSQNFPNPFSEKTYIAYQIYQKGLVELLVQNIETKKIISVIKTTQEPGKYVVRLDGKKFVSGKYIYELRTADGIVGRAFEKN